MDGFLVSVELRAVGEAGGVEVGVALARRAPGGVHVAHDGVGLEEENNYVSYDETHQKVTEKNSKFHE